MTTLYTLTVIKSKVIIVSARNYIVCSLFTIKNVTRETEALRNTMKKEREHQSLVKYNTNK